MTTATRERIRTWTPVATLAVAFAAQGLGVVVWLSSSLAEIRADLRSAAQQTADVKERVVRIEGQFIGQRNRD